MKAVLRSHHLWAGLGLLACFWLTTRLLATDTTLLLSNSMLLASSTAVAIAYVPVAWQKITRGDSPLSQRIALGIAYSWVGGSLWRIHSLLWLKAGTPAWWVQNDLIAFYQAIVTLGALYHLISPGAVGGERGEQMPSLKWIAVGSVVGLALLLASYLALGHLDTTGFVTWVRPYVPGAPER